MADVNADLIKEKDAAIRELRIVNTLHNTLANLTAVENAVGEKITRMDIPLTLQDILLQQKAS